MDFITHFTPVRCYYFCYCSLITCRLLSEQRICIYERWKKALVIRVAITVFSRLHSPLMIAKFGVSRICISRRRVRSTDGIILCMVFSLVLFFGYSSSQTCLVSFDSPNDWFPVLSWFSTSLRVVGPNPTIVPMHASASVNTLIHYTARRMNLPFTWTAHDYSAASLELNTNKRWYSLEKTVKYQPYDKIRSD